MAQGLGLGAGFDPELGMSLFPVLIGDHWIRSWDGMLLGYAEQGHPVGIPILLCQACSALLRASRFLLLTHCKKVLAASPQCTKSI